MGKKINKKSLTPIHMSRLLILAEHFESDFPYEKYKPENSQIEITIPSRIIGAKIEFSCFPFLHAELTTLFPAE